MVDISVVSGYFASFNRVNPYFSKTLWQVVLILCCLITFGARCPSGPIVHTLILP